MSIVYALVVAAGASERLRDSLACLSFPVGCGFSLPDLSGNKSKVSLEIGDGLTILDSALINLWHSGMFGGFVIVSRESDLCDLREHCVQNRNLPVDLASNIQFVKGGDTRQESVLMGLETIKGKADFVAIHDGARPFCSPEMVRSVVSAGIRDGAALLACRVTSTIKRGSGLFESPSGFAIPSVVKTVSRENLWEAQTPQVFEFSRIYEAHIKAHKEKVPVTDDSELIERSGCFVTLVEGSHSNIKITNVEDYLLAQSLYRVLAK